MKKYLLPNSGNFYKANMHVHTTISDGKNTPERMKQIYKEHGYSIVAFTDHDLMFPHPELKDENFLPITSHELEINQSSDVEGDFNFVRTYHLNLYSSEEMRRLSPGFWEPGIWLTHAKKLITDEMRTMQTPRTYSLDFINDVIEKANKAGFLVCYNHPVWSLQDYRDYIGIKGAWGIEVYNTASALGGYVDTTQPFVDLNRLGEKVFPIAADDAHVDSDCCGGWIMVRAAALEYGTVFNALKKGDFYASIGPEINEISLENGILHVECSPARQVLLFSERRMNRCVRALSGKELTCADFDLNQYLSSCPRDHEKLRAQFVRVEVTDREGKTAWSRPYFVGDDI